MGEAYDKIGRVIGVPYPGGKHIDEMARVGKDVYNFPRAMIKEDNFDFSFSGLKSAFINKVHNAEQRGETLDNNDLAASFQSAAVDVLVDKTIHAAKEYPVKQIVLAGGVSANSQLREDLAQAVSESLPGVKLIIPPLGLTGDNAAMIGAAGYIDYKQGERAGMDLNAKPGLTL